MAKTRTIYVCQNCGAESAKWIGKCPSCQQWNAYVEEIIQKPDRSVFSFSSTKSSPIPISDIQPHKRSRIKTLSKEFDRLLGGGMVPGSLILLGGEPGIGKSTMALQVLLNMENSISLYVSGEESEQQIKIRSERIGKSNENCFIYCETKLEDILHNIESIKPEVGKSIPFKPFIPKE